MKDRIELLKNNRQLIVDTLEHIKNVTNIGIKVTEKVCNISIRLPNEMVSSGREGASTGFVKYGAQLMFLQDPNDGIKIVHKMPEVKFTDEPKKGETVETIPASALNREIIFNKVIEFLERVQGENLVSKASHKIAQRQ